MPRFSQSAVMIGLLLSASLSLAGCAGLELPKFGKHAIQRTSAKNPATEILCLWQSAEGRNPNGLPARGFGGQVFFFTGKGATPAAAVGDVRIYLFSNEGTAAEQARPVHQYDFSSEAWEAHLQQTQLGPSYQVFIPYPKPVKYQTQCSLRVRFTPKDGPTIFSDMVAVTLPGPLPELDDSLGSLTKKTEKGQGTLDQMTITLSSRPGTQPVVTTSDAASSAVVPAAEHDPYEERMRRLEEKLERILQAARTAPEPPSTAEPRTLPVAAGEWSARARREEQDAPEWRPARRMALNPAASAITTVRRPVATGRHPLADEPGAEPPPHPLAPSRADEAEWQEAAPIRRQGTSGSRLLCNPVPQQASINPLSEDDSLLR